MAKLYKVWSHGHVKKVPWYLFALAFSYDIFDNRPLLRISQYVPCNEHMWCAQELGFDPYNTSLWSWSTRRAFCSFPAKFWAAHSPSTWSNPCTLKQILFAKIFPQGRSSHSPAACGPQLFHPPFATFAHMVLTGGLLRTGVWSQVVRSSRVLEPLVCRVLTGGSRTQCMRDCSWSTQEYFPCFKPNLFVLQNGVMDNTLGWEELCTSLARMEESQDLLGEPGEWWTHSNLWHSLHLKSINVFRVSVFLLSSSNR